MSVNSKGLARLQTMTISLVFYGFEPDIFKQAFRQGWNRLDQPGIDDKRKLKDAQQHSNSEESDQDEGKTKK